MKVIIETNKIKDAYKDVTDIHFCKECNTLDIIQTVYSKNPEAFDYTLKQSMLTSIPYSVINEIKIILHDEFEPILEKYAKGEET